MLRIVFLATVIMLAAPANAERKTVGIGEELIAVTHDVRENVEVAVTHAFITRSVYIVEKIRVPAGVQLGRAPSGDGYCWDKGYVTSYGEYGLCLHDRDADGKFDWISGIHFHDEGFRVKDPAPYSLKNVSISTPAKLPRKIIYLGGTATEARFSYREFTQDGLARPAFTEDLTVPISEMPAKLRLKGFEFTIYSQTSLGLDVEIAG